MLMQREMLAPDLNRILKPVCVPDHSWRMHLPSVNLVNTICVREIIIIIVIIFKFRAVITAVLVLNAHSNGWFFKQGL